MKILIAALITFSFAPLGLSSASADDPAEHLIAVAREADAVSIEFFSSSGKEEVTFSNIFWIERLVAALSFTSYKPQSHCFCISYPIIRLMRKNEVICTLSVHHGEKLRAHAGKLSGDYHVGSEAGKKIVDLANEKKKG